MQKTQGGISTFKDRYVIGKTRIGALIERGNYINFSACFLLSLASLGLVGMPQIALCSSFEYHQVNLWLAYPPLLFVGIYPLATQGVGHSTL